MRSKKNHNTPERILIIRLSAMGDVLLTTPLLRILKKHYQKMDIHFCVKKQFLLLIVDALIVFLVFLFAYIFRISIYEGQSLSILGERL